MDNQQERFDLELAWLAGIMEGEGWFSLTLVRSLKRNKKHYPAFVANVGVVNTDELMMIKVRSIWDKLGLIYRNQVIEACTGKDGIKRKRKWQMSASSKGSVLKLTKAILPYIVGSKRNRIIKLHEFYKIRESKPKAGIKSIYGPEEKAIYDELYSYRGKSRSKIPNDYTFGSPLLGDEDIV
jgi:hypothetical protein